MNQVDKKYVITVIVLLILAVIIGFTMKYESTESAMGKSIYEKEGVTKAVVADVEEEPTTEESKLSLLKNKIVDMCAEYFPMLGNGILTILEDVEDILMIILH